MRDSLKQDLECRNDDPDVREHGIPYALFGPGLDVVLAEDQPRLHRRDLRAQYVVLLRAKSNRWSQKPDSLCKRLGNKPNDGAGSGVTCSGGDRSSSAMIRRTALTPDQPHEGSLLSPTCLALHLSLPTTGIHLIRV